MKNEGKPGWKTTEFWGKIVLQVIAVLSAANGLVSPEKSIFISGVLEVLYTISRTLTKTPSITTLVDNSTTISK